MINSKNKISRINRKFDKIKYKEETGKTDRYIKNRALRKMLSNKTYLNLIPGKYRSKLSISLTISLQINKTMMPELISTCIKSPKSAIINPAIKPIKIKTAYETKASGDKKEIS